MCVLFFCSTNESRSSFSLKIYRLNCYTRNFKCIMHILMIVWHMQCLFLVDRDDTNKNSGREPLIYILNLSWFKKHLLDLNYIGNTRTFITIFFSYNLPCLHVYLSPVWLIYNFKLIFYSYFKPNTYGRLLVLCIFKIEDAG